MKINLFTSYYKDKSVDRQNELDFCIAQNEMCFTKVILLEDVDGRRPTFNDFFNLMEKYPNDINIVSNTDIFFKKEDLDKIVAYLKDSNTCLALTRWEYSHVEPASLLDRPDSQDCWIFYGRTDFRLKEDFSMGIAGCDNRIAYELQQFGLNVLNPSRSIKSYHYHLTQVRNYIDAEGNVTQRIPPPYSLIPPTI